VEIERLANFGGGTPRSRSRPNCTNDQLLAAVSLADRLIIRKQRHSPLSCSRYHLSAEQEAAEITQWFQ
jgi:hypothetical protein